jgi:hypothetical protein
MRRESGFELMVQFACHWFAKDRICAAATIKMGESVMIERASLCRFAYEKGWRVGWGSGVSDKGLPTVWGLVSFEVKPVSEMSQRPQSGRHTAGVHGFMGWDGFRNVVRVRIVWGGMSLVFK